MLEQPQPWGKICVGTRLEKQVEAGFVVCLVGLTMKGLRRGDAVLIERDKPAHVAANDLIRRFLRDTTCDTLFMLDSDADIGANFLNEFRDFERGWEFDALQAFYTRRGWPPQAIWFIEQGGYNFQCMVLDEGTNEVAMIGTHCALVRRAVFECIYTEYGGGIPFEEFEWFCYPRHQKQSDEAQLSREARQLGFRLGATTALKAGHISRVVTGWETYQEYLELSGTRERTEKFVQLSRLVAGFTGETPEAVMAKGADGVDLANRAWAEARPATAEAVRAFYGTDDYLYKILLWNASANYERVTESLHTEVGQRVLVVGGGLGSEAEILAGRNQVDVFELPGRLREFCRYRLNGRARILEGERLEQAVDTQYDLVAAIDVLEHIHPAEWNGTMQALGRAIRPGGRLHCHNNFVESGYPEHFDHSAAFEVWLREHRFERVSEYEYVKREA